MKKSLLSRSLLCTLATMAMLPAGIAPVSAATITVTASATDTLNGGNAQCSLREAIININNGATTYADCAPVGAYGSSDTINIPAGTYTTAIAGAGEDLNATGDFDILNSVSIVGAGSASTSINGSALDRVFDVIGAVTVSFSGVTITNGQATDCAPAPGLPSCGGGILSNATQADIAGTVNVTNSTISNSSTVGGGADGGGIFNSGTNRTFNITNSTISGNSTYYGGAYSGGGTLTVSGSTISGNSALFYGGGIYSNSTAVVANSTFTGNSAVNSGSAILNFTTLTITNSTISGNSGGGGAVDGFTGTTTLSNTIVANQTSGADCAGTITSNGYNLESSTSCGFNQTGDMQSQNPLLNGLANNGGATQTMALSVGSPAINAGNNAICAAAPVNGVDQRGTARPQGGVCDIGAYEYSAAVAASTAPIPTLSEWAMLILSCFMAWAAVYTLRRQRR